MEMDQDAIIRWITTALPRVETLVASREAGSPEVAWGDTFFFVGPDRRFPFATIVTKDYGEFDNASDLDRPGVFRLNVGVGKETYVSLFDAEAEAEHDFAALDRLMPHPVYGRSHWVCVLNPTEATFEILMPLLEEAHRRAMARDARSGRPGRPRLR